MRAAASVWLAIAGIAASLSAAPAVGQQPSRTPARPAPAAPAPTPETFSVAVIDIQAILRQSTAAQALQRQMQEEQSNYQGLADRQQSELQAEEEAIERERPRLAAEAYAQKRREFQERMNRTTVEFRARRRLLDEAFNAASGEINRTVLLVIEDLARSQGIQLVVRREAVLYQRAVLDLTQEAGAALNQRLPQVVVRVPPAAQP